jgi:hypothetical protein
MSDARMILIAAPELIPALRERVGAGQIVTFADTEPVRALEAIAAQRPDIIALERLFAASPRGAALIARIKSDPGLDASQILVLSHDSDYSRVSPRRPAHATARRAPRGALDRGTRHVPRVLIAEGVEAALDQEPIVLVDLSELGAQVVTARVLKPAQAVSLSLGKDGDIPAMAGTVVWVRLELTRRGPAYRAGLEFLAPDRERLRAFCDANKRE